jgi:hypothetical protein
MCFKVAIDESEKSPLRGMAKNNRRAVGAIDRILRLLLEELQK